MAGVVVAVTALVAPAAAAVAQSSVVDVPLGGTADVSNGGECAPGVQAQVFLAVADADPIPLGSVIATPEGRIDASVDIPEDLPLGPAAVVVDCGIAGSVLVYDVNLVPAEDGLVASVVSLLPYAAGVVGLLVLAGVLLRRRSENGDRAPGAPAPVAVSPAEADHDGDGPTFVASSAGVAAVPSDDAEDAPVFGAMSTFGAQAAFGTEVAGGDSAAVGEGAVGSGAMDVGGDEVDDGAEYWFWDVDTSRGPARRLACLTESAFHLDEVPVAAFPTLLSRIAEEGPDRAFSRAFLSVPLDRIDEVYRRGTEIKIAFHDEHGNPAARTVDLGSEVLGVLDLLSRRFVVHEVALPA